MSARHWPVIEVGLRWRENLAGQWEAEALAGAALFVERTPGGAWRWSGAATGTVAEGTATTRRAAMTIAATWALAASLVRGEEAP